MDLRQPGVKSGFLNIQILAQTALFAHEERPAPLLGFNSGKPEIVLAKDRYVSDPSLTNYVSQVPPAESPAWTWTQSVGSNASSAAGEKKPQ